MFVAPGQIALLARATSAATHLVVTLADGRRLRVPLERGIALSFLGHRTLPRDRPVWIAAVDRRGATIERRRSVGRPRAGACCRIHRRCRSP